MCVMKLPEEERVNNNMVHNQIHNSSSVASLEGGTGHKRTERDKNKEAKGQRLDLNLRTVFMKSIIMQHKELNIFNYCLSQETIIFIRPTNTFSMECHCEDNKYFPPPPPFHQSNFFIHIITLITSLF